MIKPAVDFYTSLSVVECQHRLSVLLKHNEHPNTQIVRGGILGKWFYMFRQTYRQNSFRPFLVGKIEETPTGTRITGRFWIHPLVIAFMIFWYSLAERTIPQISALRAAIILFLVLLLVVGVFVSWAQRDEMQDYLKEQLSTDKPFLEPNYSFSKKLDGNSQRVKAGRGSVDILLNQSVSMSKQRLLENIDEANWAGNRRVIGQVIGDWFYLYERPYNRITNLYYFYGKFKVVTQGTRIIGRYWMNPFLSLFMFLSIGGVFIKLTSDIIGYFSYYVDYGHWPLLLPRLLSLMWLQPIGGVIVVSWLLSLPSRNYLFDFLNNVFETTNIRS